MLTLFNQYNQIIGKDDRTDLKYRKIKQTVQCRMAEYNKAAILQNIIKLKYSIMKKQLLKLTMLALTFFSVSLINAQEYEEYTQRGLYTIGAADGSGLLITIDSGAPGFLKWAAPIEGGSPTQQFAITDHPAPMSAGYVQITAEIPGLGAVRLGTNAENIELDANGAPTKNITVIMKQGAIVVDDAAADYGYDQFQRRKATGWSGDGNNALFAKPPGQGNLRYSVAPTAAGDPILFNNGGTINDIRFIFVQAVSTEKFDTSSVFISNPVNDELTIKGLNQSIKQISVYDLLGKQVISGNLSDDTISTNLDVSSLTTGLYIVKLEGENGASFTKKIVKK